MFDQLKLSFCSPSKSFCSPPLYEENTESKFSPCRTEFKFIFNYLTTEVLEPMVEFGDTTIRLDEFEMYSIGDISGGESSKRLGV